MAAPLADGRVLFALFPPGTPLLPVIEQLRETGLPDAAIEVVSSFPLPNVRMASSIRIPLYPITIISGVIGIGVGLFFAAGTALMYPPGDGGKADRVLARSRHHLL